MTIGAESAGPICMHNPGCECGLSGLVFMSLPGSPAPHLEQATVGLESRSLSSLSLCQAKADKRIAQQAAHEPDHALAGSVQLLT